MSYSCLTATRNNRTINIIRNLHKQKICNNNNSTRLKEIKVSRSLYSNKKRKIRLTVKVLRLQKMDLAGDGARRRELTCETIKEEANRNQQ